MADINNLRNYKPSSSTGKEATAAGGPLEPGAVRRTKAENETNVTEEAYSKDCEKSNLGGKNTGM